MRNTKEQQILNIIKYTPPLFIIITSILITVFLFFENQKNFQKEKVKIEQEYIKENKELIKQRVERVHGFLSHFEKLTEEDLRKNIKDRVYEAHSIASSIYEKYKNIKSKDEIFAIIKTSLEDLRFNDGRGYFFMDDKDGRKVIYPIDKNIEGKVLIDFTDAKGYKFVKTIVQTLKDKSERYDTYYWYKPNENDKKTYKKISFYKYFEPFDLVIGTGEYIDDYQKHIQKRVLDYVSLLRYEKMGYVFILDYDGTYLSHIDEKLLGKNVKDVYAKIGRAHV